MRLHEFVEENPSYLNKNNVKLSSVDETAGVGIYDARSNKTVDVGPDTLKKTAKAFNFDVTKGGIPPILNPDGTWNTKEKVKK